MTKGRAKNSDWGHRIWGWLGVVLAILIISVLGAQCLARLLGDEDSSGWAQLIGAVLAIGAGFWGGATDRADQRADERERESAAARAAL